MSVPRCPIFFFSLPRVNIHLLYVDSAAKSAVNYNASRTKRKSSTALPKLNSHTDFAPIDPDSNVTNSLPTENTCLPILNREDPTNKPIGKECKLYLVFLMPFMLSTSKFQSRSFLSFQTSGPM